MTPFMLDLQESLARRDGGPPRPATRPARPRPVGAGAHAQVEIRALAEQRVAEANAVLAGHGRRIQLEDLPGADGVLGFVLRCGARSARVETTLGPAAATSRLAAGDRAESAPSRELADASQVEALITCLVTGDS